MYVFTLKALELWNTNQEKFKEERILKNKNGHTPLHLLCKSVENLRYMPILDLFKTFADGGPEILLTKDMDGDIHIICKQWISLEDRYILDILNTIADKCPQILVEQNNNGDTPLHCLIRSCTFQSLNNDSENNYNWDKLREWINISCNYIDIRYIQNQKDESVLHLVGDFIKHAQFYDMTQLVEVMFDGCTNEQCFLLSDDGMSVLENLCILHPILNGKDKVKHVIFNIFKKVPLELFLLRIDILTERLESGLIAEVEFQKFMQCILHAHDDVDLFSLEFQTFWKSYNAYCIPESHRKAYWY
eukprot:TRINITY_DN69411_c0_g1_i1.p1 TRINITY_DN69411_c0_g1~~TRINITY_DN69411_c0_g1_i1.p1  ORF type:complete len:303 (-),score=34.08 TRINITY_DN69411_c0_g1_i1:707-1615(-)